MVSVYVDPDGDNLFKSSLPAQNTTTIVKPEQVLNNSLWDPFTETGSYKEDVGRVVKLKATIAELELEVRLAVYNTYFFMREKLSKLSWPPV